MLFRSGRMIRSSHFLIIHLCQGLRRTGFSIQRISMWRCIRRSTPLPYRKPEGYAGLRPCTPASSKELNINKPGEVPGLWSYPVPVRHMSGIVSFGSDMGAKKSGTVCLVSGLSDFILLVSALVPSLSFCVP